MPHPVVDPGGVAPPSKDILKIHGDCQGRDPGSGSNIPEWNCVCSQNNGRRFLRNPPRRAGHHRTLRLHDVGGSNPIEIYAILKDSPTTACLVGTEK